MQYLNGLFDILLVIYQYISEFSGNLGISRKSRNLSKISDFLKEWNLLQNDTAKVENAMGLFYAGPHLYTGNQRGSIA